MPKVFFTATILALAVSSATASAETPQEMAKKVETFYKDRADIRAIFQQKVRKPGRSRVLTKKGSVFFKVPGMMRWEYKKPEKVFYVSDGKTLWIYQPEDGLVTKLDVRSSELYHQSRYLFGQGNLATDFELAEEKAPEGQFGLVLAPRKGSRDFKKLTLFIDQKTGEIANTRLIDPYDNVSEITFEKVQYKPVDEKHFQFTPPAGATIKDLSRKSPTGKKPVTQ